MKLFSESVKYTNTNSTQNILQVENFTEIFFDVFEVEINKTKYPVEKISTYKGNPVVSVPVVIGEEKHLCPFVLIKGPFEILFNADSFREWKDVPPPVLPTLEEDAPNETADALEELQETVKWQIEKAKKDAKTYAEQIKSKKLKEANLEISEKRQALSRMTSNARASLVEEFLKITNNLKGEVLRFNGKNFDEIKETIDNKIVGITDDLLESLKDDLSNFSTEFDGKIREIIHEMYTSLISPKVDIELEKISTEITEKVKDIDQNLNLKLKGKADLSLLKEVEDGVDLIRNETIELNSTLNKSVNKALSRIGQVNTKVDDLTIALSESLDSKIEQVTREINDDYTEKLKLLENQTHDITSEVKKYLTAVIEESRTNLITEIQKIKTETPIQYVMESKSGNNIPKDWIALQKELDKKISDRIDRERLDLRKYVSVYASGGGTNAVQYANGGTMNGNLIIVGSISASQYLGITTSEEGGDDVAASTKVRNSSSNWDSVYTTVQGQSSNWSLAYNSLTNYLPLSGGTISGNLVVQTSTVVNTISAAAGSLSNPSYSFQSDSDTGIFSPAADTLAFATSGVNRMTVLRGGQVNIGTLVNTTLAPLRVQVDANGRAFVLSYSTTEYVDFISGTVLKGMRGFGTVPFTFQNDGDIVFATGGNTARMRLSANGYVGIGTASPLTKLHIAGDSAQATATSTPIITLERPYSPGISYGTGASISLGSSSASTSFSKTSGTAGRLDFNISVPNSLSGTHTSIGLSAIMSVLGTGQVGVGTTTPSPSSSLTVYKQLVNDGQGGAFIDVNPGSESTGIKMGAVRIGNANYPGIWLGQTSPSVTNYAFLRDGTGGTVFNTPIATNMSYRVNNTQHMLISANGNVGIGTANRAPACRLEVSSTTDNSFRLTKPAGGWNYIEFYDSTTRKGYFGIASNGNDFTFAPVGNTTIPSGGLGVGTTTPNQRLTVNGNISATGGLALSDSISAANGFLGLGTQFPTSRLHVVGGNGNQVDLTPGDTGWFTRIYMGTTGTLARWIINGYGNNGLATAGMLSFANGYTGQLPFNMLPSGFVGMGTTAPNERLTIAGNISATGNINILGVAANIKEVSTNYTVLGTDYTVVATQPITIILPSIVGIAGKLYNIKNLSSGSVTVSANGAELIDTANTWVLAPTNNIPVQARETIGWIIL